MDKIKFFQNEFKTESLQFCNSKELRFYELFNTNSQYFRFGYLVYLDKKLIGAIKIKGEKTFLLFNESLKIYQLPLQFTEFLKNIKKEKNRTWFYINILSNLYLRDFQISIEDLDKVIKKYPKKNKDYKRELWNNIEKEIKLWKHRKKFDLEIDLDKLLVSKYDYFQL